MKVWIVFEYNDYTTDKVVGVFLQEEDAVKRKNNSVWRYIKEYKVE